MSTAHILGFCRAQKLKKAEGRRYAGAAFPPPPASTRGGRFPSTLESVEEKRRIKVETNLVASTFKFESELPVLALRLAGKHCGVELKSRQSLLAVKQF